MFLSTLDHIILQSALKNSFSGNLYEKMKSDYEDVKNSSKYVFRKIVISRKPCEMFEK